MAIEFHCSKCGKFLSTDESKAGRQAKCPGCGDLITVPQASTVEAGGDAGEDAPVAKSARPSRPCPMCGAEVPTGAKACPACGEELTAAKGGTHAGGPVKFEAGEVISTAWEISKRNLGFLVALVLVAIILNLVVQLPGIAASVMAQMEMQQGGKPNLGLLLFSNLWNIPTMLFSLFITCGQVMAFLRVARGEDAGIGDLFGGGRYFLKMLLNYVVVSIAVAVGLVLCIIPGLFVLVCLWPFMFVLVAEDRPGLETLSRTWELTKINRGSSLLLLIAMFGIYVLGILACLIGVLVALPVCVMAATVAYLRMSGQPTVLETEAV